MRFLESITEAAVRQFSQKIRKIHWKISVLIKKDNPA